MITLVLSSLILLPSLLLLLSSLNFGPFKSKIKMYNFSIFTMYLSLVASLVIIAQLIFGGSTTLQLFDYQNLGISLKLDTLSASMYTMIAIIGLVVVRYGKNYLHGHDHYAQFFGKLALTIASVQLFVLSGNIAILFLAWVGTSVGLHKLLLFFPQRAQSRLAAKKKYVIARLSDLSLLAAFACIYQVFGTGDLRAIFEGAKSTALSTNFVYGELACIFLVITACLKSVQVPFHSWLLDVMETPTPVSALLHAGLLNAGPYLIIRFSYLMEASNYAWVILIIVGALSALYGAVISSTQPTVKTSLAYSSIGHMGFSLMTCGMGIYPAALLHLMAHSFYKAYAFLSSGSIVDVYQTKNATQYSRNGKLLKIAVAVVSAFAVYSLSSLLWVGFEEMSFQLTILSVVILFGMLNLHINAIDSSNTKNSIFRLILTSAIVINSFYFFETLFHLLLGDTIPALRVTSPMLQNIAYIILGVYFLTILVLSYAPKLSNSNRLQNLKIHLKQGLYFNHIMNRALNALQLKK